MSSLAVNPLMSAAPAAPPADGLAEALIVAFATADDVAAGMERVTALLAEAGAAARVEWWAPAADGASLRLAAAAGDARGGRTALPIGPVGALVVVAEGRGRDALDALGRLAPVVRRRWTDERLADHAALLARRVQALDDFAALVAHELKGPLQAALLTDDPAPEIRRALHVVDSVIEAVRSESATDACSSPQACLDDALRELGRLDAEVSSALPAQFPLSAVVLRIVLRNLLANAAAAGAGRIHVWGAAGEALSTLGIDDDGAGVGSREYAAGSGIALALCRRLVERLGGELELRARPEGGTTARIALRRGQP
jgi:signal transduction histidine kinase